MAKSANDSMMTRPQLSGCSGTPHPTCVLSWSGDGSPVVCTSPDPVSYSMLL